MSIGKWNDDNLPAPALDFARADDGLGCIIPALHDHVRTQRFYQLQRRVLIERNDEIHRLESRQNVSAILRVANGTSGSFEPLHGSVGIDSNDQRITVCPRSGEQINVTPMQQIEDTVGEDDFSREILPACDRFLARRCDLVGG